MTSPNSLSSQPSHCLMRSQPIIGQHHPGAYTSYVMSENEEYDPTYMNFSSIVHEDSNEINSVSPTPSEGRGADLLIVDTNIDGLQSDSWPDIEILEEKFNSNLRRCVYLEFVVASNCLHNFWGKHRYDKPKETSYSFHRLMLHR